MLITDKYRPINHDDFIVHKEFRDRIHKMATHDKGIPHIILYGPEGSGKKTLSNFLLKSFFGDDFSNVKDITYKVSGNSNTSTEVVMKQSSHHIVIEPNNNNHDKYIIQDVIKKYASTDSLIFGKNKKFKVVLINNIDKLSNNAQAALRRNMEVYAGSCRFILICRSLSKVMEPLKSRCCCLRIPRPEKTELYLLIMTVTTLESIEIDDKEIKKILKLSERNIKSVLWLLELKKYGFTYETSVDEITAEIVVLILDASAGNRIIDSILKIREKLYKLLITNVSFSETIKNICDLLTKKINSFKKKRNLYLYSLFENACIFEHRCNLGRREITHLDGFIIAIIDDFYSFSN